MAESFRKLLVDDEPVSSPPPPRIATTSASPLPCRILVVDDDPVALAQTTSMLTNGGYEVHCARSGEEALRVLQSHPCQIVMTDWEMPGMDGVALCRKLRLRDLEKYTYVVLLTVRKNEDDMLTGLSAGADDFLVKTASAQELMARLAVGRRITDLEGSLRTSLKENQRLAVTDALTGAFNRRYLMRQLPRELARAQRYRRALAVLCCDLDSFKRINDGFGHEAGDEVLQAFASRAAASLREPVDWIARSGGEEFVVVLPETSLCGGGAVAEKLRHSFSNDSILTSYGPLKVTVSIGVTAVEVGQGLHDVVVADLLRAADKGLYLSKTLGRDRITCLPPHESTLPPQGPLAGATPGLTSRHS